MPNIKVKGTVVFQYSLFSSEDHLVLAPMQNLTSLFYRKVYEKYFPKTFNYAISPFISATSNIQHSSSITYKDVMPSLNKDSIPIVPQILGNNGEEILSCCKVLEEMNYREVNLNFACPKRDIVNHGRGAGMLLHKDIAEKIIDSILANTHLNLSIKVRLGVKDRKALRTFVPIFNAYPLKNIIIHARSADMQYTGNVDIEEVKYLVSVLKSNVIYNGDIFSVEDFARVKTELPEINYWMIGRGVLRNPFLASEIRGINVIKENIIKSFMSDLINEFSTSLRHYNENTVLNKMKEFIKYLSVGQHFNPTLLLHSTSLKEFIELLENTL